VHWKNKQCNSFSLTLRSCLNPSWKTSTTCLTQERSPTCLHQRIVQQSTTSSLTEPKQTMYPKLERPSTPTLSSSVVKICILSWHSHLLEMLSEIDADSSLLLSTVRQLTGIMPGLRMHSTLSHTESMKRRLINLRSVRTWMCFQKHLSLFTCLFVKSHWPSMMSSGEIIT